MSDVTVRLCRTMRSLGEIAFRLRQEIGNLTLFVRKPRIPRKPLLLHGLPAVEGVICRLRGTEYARNTMRLADAVLDGRFELLGYEIETGSEIDWRRDYVHGLPGRLKPAPPAYFRRVPYLDFARVGDHKVVWELNRHQHLVILAQAYRLTNREEYLRKAVIHLESWFAANPYGRGINWTSALEVAFRALSWIWFYHLAGERLDPEFQREFATQLFRHGCYLEKNLSVYFSPNTHLLGEAVALHALGALAPDFPRARIRERTGGEFASKQADRQVQSDGSHFEQSSYYHVYALDMLLFHYLLAERPAALAPRLVQMAEYLDALMGPQRRLPFLGDDDGGRFFHPYGDRARFGRATLATCGALFGRPEWIHDREDLCEQAAWWLGEEAWRDAPPTSSSGRGWRLFPAAGIAVMEDGPTHVVADAGRYGAGSAGHSHSDALSFVVRCGEDEILTDSGTFTYLADPRRRDWFRGSAAHNTIRVNGLDQAKPVNPFRWLGRPEVKVLEWTTCAETDYLDASCRHNGFNLRRRILFVKPGLLVVLDAVEGPPGEQLIEQFWHFGKEEFSRRLRVSAPGSLEKGGEHGWRSTAYGRKEAAPVLRVAVRSALPAVLGAVLDLGPDPATGEVTVLRNGDAWNLKASGGRAIEVEFPVKGLPRVHAQC